VLIHDVHAFQGDPCPTCCRPLRAVAGGQRPNTKAPGQSERVDEYRCELGHVFHARVERHDPPLTFGLYPGSGHEGGTRVHYA
jgi:hypothetical protein